MNPNSLKYFLEVARCKSIRRASERLHVAASAVSRQISALESEMDCVLLNRRSDGVALTEAGERLWAHGVRIEAQFRLVQSDIDDLKALRRGTISLATVEGITESFLPQILAEFSQTYPDISFKIEVASRDETVDTLDRYEAEIGFVYDFSSHHAVGVVAHYHQPLLAFVTPNHPLSSGREVSLKELMQFEHVLPDSSFGISQLVNRVAKKEGAIVAPKAISNNLQFLQSFARSKCAVHFVPVQAVYAEVRDGLLVPVNLKCDAFMNRNLSIAVRHNRELSTVAVLFSQFASDRFETWVEHDKKALDDARTRWWT